MATERIESPTKLLARTPTQADTHGHPTMAFEFDETLEEWTAE